MEISEKEIRKIMKTAEDSGAWLVCIMLAKVLNDNHAVNKYAHKLVAMIQWNIASTERTPERLEAEKQKILAEL